MNRALLAMSLMLVLPLASAGATSAPVSEVSVAKASASPGYCSYLNGQLQLSQCLPTGCEAKPGSPCSLVCLAGAKVMARANDYSTTGFGARLTCSTPLSGDVSCSVSYAWPDGFCAAILPVTTVVGVVLGTCTVWGPAVGTCSTYPLYIDG
jgi:hypothetical protein